MSVLNAVVKQLNKAIIKATTAGDTRAVNKLTKLVDKPDAVTNRMQQIKAKQADFDDEVMDTYIHQTSARGDINEDNFRYRSGSTPAAAGKGEGIFTSPTSYADQNVAYGPRELGVVTARAAASKLGQGQTRLAMEGPDVPETFIPKAQVREIFEIKPATMQLTEIGDNVVRSISRASNNFKASVKEMRVSNDIKKLFAIPKAVTASTTKDGVIEYPAKALYHGTTKKGLTKLSPEASRRTGFGAPPVVSATENPTLAKAFTRGELGLDPKGETLNINETQRTYGDVYRFKTATVLNDRVYIGNLYNTTTGEVSPDRILKTEPGQHDIFPDDGFHHIDLSVGYGDSIVHMESYFG